MPTASLWVRSVRVNDHTTRWVVDDVISVVEGAELT